MALATVEKIALPAKVTFLCRPDGLHYCTECCQRMGAGCCLLGKLEDGTQGCLGYNGKKFDGITQTHFCQELNCLRPAEDPEALRQIITAMPPGSFRMSEVLKIYYRIPAPVGATA